MGGSSDDTPRAEILRLRLAVPIHVGKHHAHPGRSVLEVLPDLGFVARVVCAVADEEQQVAVRYLVRRPSKLGRVVDRVGVAWPALVQSELGGTEHPLLAVFPLSNMARVPDGHVERPATSTLLSLLEPSVLQALVPSDGRVLLVQQDGVVPVLGAIEAIHQAACVEAMVEIAVHVRLRIERVRMSPEAADQTPDGRLELRNENLGRWRL